jgi:hypothetical protein
LGITHTFGDEASPPLRDHKNLIVYFNCGIEEKEKGGKIPIHKGFGFN